MGNVKTRVVTFIKDNNSYDVECEVVDLQDKEWDRLFEHALLYRKACEVHARQATKREVVYTPLDATSSIAESGDWIVTNPQGEMYKVKNNTFCDSYMLKEGETDVYRTLGIPVKAVRISRDIVFYAPWGNYQAVQKGGFIVERQDNRERYGIEEEAFFLTYQSIK